MADRPFKLNLHGLEQKLNHTLDEQIALIISMLGDKRYDDHPERPDWENQLEDARAQQRTLHGTAFKREYIARRQRRDV